MRNSSSIKGRTGEKIVLAIKLRAHRELRNRRYRNALPFKELNLIIFTA